MFIAHCPGRNACFFLCLITVLLLAVSMNGWAGTRIGPGGYTITGDVVSSGGAMLTQGAFSIAGAAGQAAVGQSVGTGGTVAYHGVFGPLAGQGAQEGEGVVEGEGEPEGVPEGEGELAGLAISIVGGNLVTIAANSSHTFETVVSGQTGTVSYQWYLETPEKAVTRLLGEEGPVYTLEHAKPSDEGLYFCEATDDLTTVLSNKVELSVVPGTPAAGIPGVMLLCLGIIILSALLARRKMRHGH